MEVRLYMTTRSNAPILASSNRRRATNNRPCNDCLPAPVAPNPQLLEEFMDRMIIVKDPKPDDQSQTKYVSGYRKISFVMHIIFCGKRIADSFKKRCTGG